ncbi:peroxidase family protein [Botrimarina mediterranea]|uniref:Peroxidase n=1 Tax=Botrimarina mediterranea TaxID=2528022 RepID=A0A518KBA4_9BACT|nr:peroxidase family protein [Botrimarina mediterranea]QDV75075.1 peroxidase [Botrimarina mediterranea]QDV79721.1 peroxidase [Planctomycetes bacterium K2D]
MRLHALGFFVLAFVPISAFAEVRTYDGTGNNVAIPTRGAAGTGMIRFGYSAEFLDSTGAMITDAQRANARDISNAIFAQSSSVKSMRGLSDFAWGWGQFVTHDIELLKTDNGPVINGFAPIAVNNPADVLAPGPIPFVRADFTTIPGRGGGRSPVNYVSSYLDGSVVYGSDATRAAALRDTGGKLLLDPSGLLPRNTAGLEVENNGPLPSTSMFLAGDIRANENPLLTSLQTVFAREHNRLVDAIAVQRPGLDDEGRYQLARQLVGAEIQAITYREFLPALIGGGTSTQNLDNHQYLSGLDSSVTNAFANAAFRLGHSQVSSDLTLVDETGVDSTLPLRNAFHNPALIDADPSLVDTFLRGAARQRSEEIDTLVVDDLRNALFGPPGSGGLDLAAINIQRGRDAGLPNYRNLKSSHGAGGVQTFSQITSDPELAEALATVYGNNLSNIDAWVGGLAEDHVAGGSVGRMFHAIIDSQFRRLRDGDRLFYTGVAAGLYIEGELDPLIRSLVDLDTVTLADIIQVNTGVTSLQDNVFFVPGFTDLAEGDLNGDGVVNAADYTLIRDGATSMTDDAMALFRTHYGYHLGAYPSSGGNRSVSVPEPTAAALLAAVAIATVSRRR